MATLAQPSTREISFSSTQLPVRVTGMQAMASKMWVPFIAMGFMVVLAAFIFGLVNSSITSDYFQASKEVREAAVTGSALATQKAFMESTKAWLPSFKFLGMGMILGGVTFLLATILGALRTGGGRVQEAVGVPVKVIKPPMTATVFPMLMMMGMMVLIASLVIGIVLAFISYGYWNHSIATELNPATAGSALLNSLANINTTTAWLAPFKFVGIGLVLSGIGLALATIVRVLRWQSQRLWDILS
ncbi:MAG: hypothetical protein J4N84_09005 [Chloroflexi bacterium]|nr:hypothetical protein [Chloroflexota bacterium]MCH8349496.1 hypothetical protein [Chloroflexota bacterium]MCI0797441.1 hypothetical protein [Chloroflexota bacterium]MCI0823231.1 hypothetical protein [Chloroflexota bacterium]MCI0895023.1 hypothetical protein [Chloroflexota bacterium]